MTIQPDFFGGEHQVKIKDNVVLEKACNRLLNMVNESPELLDGDTMSEINHRIYAELLWRDCFQTLIATEKKEIFMKAMTKAPNTEVYTRAVRELLSRDLIRISAHAIRNSEQYRARIAGAMRG